MNSFKKKFLGGAAAGAAVLALSACLLPTGDGEGLTISGDVPPPDTNLTYIQAQIFSKKCADCHGGNTPFAGLNLSSVAATRASIYDDATNTWKLASTAPTVQPRYRILGGELNDSGRVLNVAGASVDSSFIYQKVTAGPYKQGGGSRMPLGRPSDFLTPDELGLLEAWIKKGASLK